MRSRLRTGSIASSSWSPSAPCGAQPAIATSSVTGCHLRTRLMTRAPLAALLALLLLCISPAAASPAPGLRVLSAYCAPINVWAAAPAHGSLLLAEALNCSEQSPRVLINATSAPAPLPSAP